MKRHVKTELLDVLPAQDPGAIRSRRDLRRLNAWMGGARILARVLRGAFPRHLTFRIVELGAGDGDLLLRVARQVRGHWRGLDATLVDRQDLLTPETRAQFAGLNWRVRLARDDVFHWLRRTAAEKVEVIVVNLFLHHLDEAELRELFRAAAAKADVLIALEPRRGRWPLLCSRLLGFAGCGSVTRHDAPASVRAGFDGGELSALWPNPEQWSVAEQPAGWFSHLFIAKRLEQKKPAKDGLFDPIVSAVFHRDAAAGPKSAAGAPAGRQSGSGSAAPNDT